MTSPRASSGGRFASPSPDGQPRQRFTREHPCPVCGGCPDDPRGVGKRCAGYIQGDWIYCTREESGRGCQHYPTTTPPTWSHRLRGKCKCGVEHNPDLVITKPGASKSDGRKFEDQYEYPDKEGKLLYVKTRWRLPNGEKTFSYSHPGPDGRLIPGLGGRKTVLYNLPAIAAAAPGSIIYIVEGEKDVKRLKKEEKLATCNPEGAAKDPESGRKAKCKWLDRYSDDLVGFHCPVIQDNDKAGRDHAQGVARSLHGKAASVKILDLVKLMQDLPEKGDVSDFLDAGGRVDQLNELARQTAEWKPSAEQESRAATGQERFANFRARIVREIVRHEAGETTRQVEVEAIHDDGTVMMATVPAGDFESMGWVSSQLGLKFAILTGHGTKDRFQHSIRVNSYPGVKARDVFTSVGWHTVAGKDIYLHAGGGIGGNGETDIHVDVSSELALYRLPAPDLSRLKEGIERVLAILDNLGNDAQPVASILTTMPYRALLGPSRTVPHFAGTTGTLKTSTACLAARFYAPELEYFDSMPLSWQSTQAGLERLRYVAKDSLLVIDNLIADGEQAHRDLAKADSVINSQGDLAGKARMKTDGSPAPRLDPRGCIISTGECEPRRKSSAGRSIIIEFKPGLINLDGLKRCHDDARGGWYALTIACYAEYLASPGRLEAQRFELRRLAQRHQADAMENYPGCHLRHVEAVAEWTAGWELFLRFAMEQKAITKRTAESSLTRVRSQLFLTLPMQAEIQDEADPGEIYINMIRALLGSKRAVLADTDGMPPSDELAPACGWRQGERFDHGREVVPCWEQAGAARIGWIDGDMVYLEPSAAYAAVERIAREQSEVVGSKRQVHTRLMETGRIKTDAQIPGQRRRFTKRAFVEKHRREVLWVPHDVLFLAKP